MDLLKDLVLETLLMYQLHDRGKAIVQKHFADGESNKSGTIDTKIDCEQQSAIQEKKANPNTERLNVLDRVKESCVRATRNCRQKMGFDDLAHKMEGPYSSVSYNYTNKIKEFINYLEEVVVAGYKFIIGNTKKTPRIVTYKKKAYYDSAIGQSQLGLDPVKMAKLTIMQWCLIIPYIGNPTRQLYLDTL